MKHFDSLSLLPAIQESLKGLGFTEPTEIQAKIIPQLLENYSRDVHAQAQTGTGKTLAFGIPLLQAIDPEQKGVQGLILAPTRELVLQIYESLKDVSRGANISIEPIYGGMPINKQMMLIKKGINIIVGTPGRINDLLRRKALKFNKLKLLVLDEADIMLDMGFRPDIDEVLEHAPKDRNIWLFSATVMSGIKKLIQSHMNDVLSVKVAKSGGTSAQVSQYFCLVPQKKRIEATQRFIEAAPNFYGIIFVRTKALAAEVAEELASTGLQVNCLHGDMKQSLRNHVIKGFKQKDFNILVATDVAARGIDVSDLTHVINYSIPDDHESYIHRIGRTGRAGKEGVAILMVSPKELYRVKRIERATNSKLMEISVPGVEAILNVKMSAVSDFIEQTKKNEKPDHIDSALAKMVDAFSPEEIRTAFEYLLKDKFFKGVDEKKGSKREAPSTPQEICMEAGKNKKLTEEQVRSYLYTTCKLLPQEVTKVRVIRDKTFISIPDNRLEECIKLMKQKPITKKKPKIYLVEDDYQPRTKQPHWRKRTQGKKKHSMDPRKARKRR